MIVGATGGAAATGAGLAYIVPGGGLVPFRNIVGGI